MAKTSTSFKPGEVHNPNGRPKAEWTMKGLIQEALEEEHESGVPHKVIIARKLINVAETGDMVAIKEVNQRIDGMPKQDVELDGQITHILITRKEDQIDESDG